MEENPLKSKKEYISGLNINNITEDHVAEILRLYQEILGGNISILRVVDLLNDLKNGRGDSYYDGYRIGSRWTNHSKLYFKHDLEGNLTALFNPNFDPQDKDSESYKKACKAGQSFQEAVSKLR
jgi:hypothetical protein